MLSLHSDDAQEERRVRARVLVYVAVLFGFVALLLGLFAREALDIIAPSFDGAADAVGLLALGLACQGVGVVAAAGITIARKTPLLVTYTAAALVVNVSLCFALHPFDGASRCGHRHASLVCGARGASGIEGPSASTGRH